LYSSLGHYQAPFDCSPDDSFLLVCWPLHLFQHLFQKKKKKKWALAVVVKLLLAWMAGWRSLPSYIGGGGWFTPPLDRTLFLLEQDS
jgi:hypothetical protein